MPNPVTNIEMEDVLASIRRLVSDEPARSRKSATFGADRLVLTPAQRVAEAVVPIVPEEIEDATDVEVATDIEAPTPVGHSASLSTTSQPETSVDQATGFDAMETDLPMPKQSQTDAPAPLFLHSPVRPGIANMDSEARLASRRALEARIAELESAVTRTPGEFEPDGSEPDAEHMPERHVFESVVGRARRVEKPQDEGEESALQDLIDADVATAEPLLETENEAAPTPVQEAPRKPLIEAIAADSDDVLVDETALRDMVADIVREELQGALGERLTRNVRRLVRREIQQALSLKEFK